MTLFPNSFTVRELISDERNKDFNDQNLMYCIPSAIEEEKTTGLASLRPREKAINVIGGGISIDCSNEFSEVMAAAEIRPVQHISDCLSFADFYLWGCSSYNILIEAKARPIVEYIKKSLGIPYCYIPHHYGMESIFQDYCRLEAFLNVKLSTAAYREKAEKSINFYCQRLGAISLAVGEAVNANPFELARALATYGFNVPYIFSAPTGEDDQAHIDWLVARRPGITVFQNSHPGIKNFPEQKLKVDLAIGLDSEFLYPGTRTIRSSNSQPYGYEGVVALLREMTMVMSNPHPCRPHNYANNFMY